MSGDQLMRQEATNDNIINPDLELNLGIYLYIYVFHLSDLSSNLKVINGHTNIDNHQKLIIFAYNFKAFYIDLDKCQCINDKLFLLSIIFKQNRRPKIVQIG